MLEEDDRSDAEQRERNRGQPEGAEPEGVEPEGVERRKGVGAAVSKPAEGVGEGRAGALDIAVAQTLLPEAAAESYAELVNLDAAYRVRWARVLTPPRTLDHDPLDLQILALVAAMRHVLTSQIHRRFNSQRAVTTTQRRLKRLSDAGLVTRFQFHRRDGGGAPMCYVITTLGLELLRSHQYLDSLAQGEAGETRDRSPNPPRLPPQSLLDARLPRCPSRVIAGCARHATTYASPGG